MKIEEITLINKILTAYVKKVSKTNYWGKDFSNILKFLDEGILNTLAFDFVDSMFVKDEKLRFITQFGNIHPLTEKGKSIVKRLQ